MTHREQEGSKGAGLINFAHSVLPLHVHPALAAVVHRQKVPVNKFEK